MDEAYRRTAEFQTILEIAEALRGEFGAEIDVHPGGRAVEAGQVNRAFRVAAACILKATVARGDDLPGMLSWVLRQVAERRLVESGVGDAAAGILLDLEPSLGDAWYAYLALAPETVIRALVEDDESG